jgi:hypothetical protein
MAIIDGEEFRILEIDKFLGEEMDVFLDTCR